MGAKHLLSVVTPTHINQAEIFTKLIADFLGTLEAANRSPHTRRTYASNLADYATFCQLGCEGHSLPPESHATLKTYFETLTHQAPATLAHKQAALTSLFRWAYQQDRLGANPMEKVERVKLPPSQIDGVGRKQVEAVLTVIPAAKGRDRLLFRLIFETGLRVGEALALCIEDIDLTLDNEHIQVSGEGDKQRLVLLDNARLVQELNNYLKRTGYTSGPLFRAEKNNRGGPLRYQTVQATWARYTKQAGINCTLQQLRHTHATELVKGGVSLPTIRKHLGHQSLQTTLRYVPHGDQAPEAELRAWRKRQQQPG